MSEGQKKRIKEELWDDASASKHAACASNHDRKFHNCRPGDAHTSSCCKCQELNSNLIHISKLTLPINTSLFLKFFSKTKADWKIPVFVNGKRKHLNVLAVISINEEFAWPLWHDELINDFAARKCRPTFLCRSSWNCPLVLSNHVYCLYRQSVIFLVSFFLSCLTDFTVAITDHHVCSEVWYAFLLFVTLRTGMYFLLWGTFCGEHPRHGLHGSWVQGNEAYT